MTTKPKPVNSFAETLKDVLDESDVSQVEIAKATGIPEPHLSAMKHGNRRITAEYDIRLARYFGLSEGYWLRLQLASDLYNTKLEIGSKINKEVKPLVTV